MDSVTAQPLVGRTETVRQVVSAVRRADSSGAVIVADWGMGKTALMRAVVRELSESVRVFKLHASEASSRVPYGSLGPLLVGSPAGEVLSLASVLRVVTARLEETDHNAGAGTGSAQGLPLLVIDAGDYLDASSTVVIEQLIAVRKVKVLMASRDGATTGGLSMAEGLLTRHYLNPLNFAEVHELCEQMLGGTVAGGTSAALTQISGGNPRLLLALISQARRIGQLESSNAVWLLSGDSVPFDRTLADLIQSELATLSEDVRELLEVVAIAEPLPLSVVFSLGGYDAVDTLSAAKLITISGAPEPLVRSRDILLGEVIRQLVPVGRGMRLRERLAEHTTAGAESVDAQARDVRWSLGWGFTVSAGELVDAARTAIDSFDPDFAISAVGAVKDPNHVWAARVERAWACYYRDEQLKASELLEGFPKAVTDLATLKRAVLLNTRLRSHQENPAYNLPREAQDWSAALDRITGNKPKAGTSAEVDFTQRTIGLLVQSISVSQGHYDDSAAILEDVLADAESAGDDEAVLLALTMLGECATATGRPETGARLSGRALSLITSNGHRWRIHYEYVLTRHVMALIRSSQWSDIATVHQQYWATSWRSSVYSGGAIDFARSLVSLTQARTQHQPQTQGRDIGPGGVELAQLAAAIEGLKCHDLEHLLPLSLGTAAYVAALLKQRELAEQYCADFGRAQQGGPRDLQLLSQGFSAAADYLLTKDERTIQELASLANQAQDAGMATTELELRLLMLGNGTMPSGTRLLALTEQMEGPQAALTHSCVQAIAEGNVTRLLQVADDARETAHGILALICLKEALRLAEHAGNPTEIRKVRQTLALAHGKPINPGNLVQTTKLTKRERAVAALAIDGQSNAGIADKLFLSVRTVEGHLYKVFEKLGINRREDLTRDHLNEH